MRALTQAGVRHVLVGELAEVLHGSPLLSLGARLEIVPRAGQRERLTAAISAAGGNPAAPAPATVVAIEAPARFTLGSLGTELVVHPAPAGTQGYDDLRRDAATLTLDENLDVAVASLVDLIRMAEASDDRARVPALRRTLELATAPPAASAA